MAASSNTRHDESTRVSLPVLLFDLVGTLVDEASDYESLDAAMAKARQRFRLSDDAATLSGDFSLALMEILRSEDPGEGDDAPPADNVPFEEAAKQIFAAVLEVRGIDATDEDVEWFWEEFVNAQRRIVRVHNDAVRCLEWAKAEGFRVWLVTDADPYVATQVLPGKGLDGLYEGIVTAGEAGDPKPDAKIFKLALARAGVDAADAIMIGDSYERDIEGARGAGIARAVLVDRHKARTVKDCPVVSSLLALPAALSTEIRSTS